MLFSSHIFIFVFLPIAFMGYHLINKFHFTIASKVWLIFASLFFYAWWNISYLPLIILSMIVNYKFSTSMMKIEKVSLKKLLLYLSLLFNLGLLSYFKYMDFFIENLNLTFDSDVSLLHLALPLGISFYTLQQITYAVDSYKGLIKKENFLNYAIFVTFFPQLIAGPIVHHKEMMPQFYAIKNKVLNLHNIAAGFFIFSIGLFKKIMIADYFAVIATKGFDYSEILTFAAAWTTSLAYTFQLYFDFSGYTDMAIGLALLFNIKLPINFNSPYKATNIQDFWRRWHMTLSRFLKDYVYIPLGGNRQGSFRTYNNLFATFLLAGIWHGAGWTFVFWGLLHGGSLIIHRFWSNLGLTMPRVLGWFITFNFINLAWVFFRAREWDDALKVLKGMSGLADENILSILTSLQGLNIKTTLALFAGFVVVLMFKNSMQQLEVFKFNYKTICFTSMLFVVSVLSMDKITEFIYFNF